MSTLLAQEVKFVNFLIFVSLCPKRIYMFTRIVYNKHKLANINILLAEVLSGLNTKAFSLRKIFLLSKFIILSILLQIIFMMIVQLFNISLRHRVNSFNLHVFANCEFIHYLNKFIFGVIL